jgi:hypothetical protein
MQGNVRFTYSLSEMLIEEPAMLSEDAVGGVELLWIWEVPVSNIDP